MTRADLEAYRAVEREPLSVEIKPGRLFNAPPPTQGLASLMILGLFERLGVERAESFAHVHGLIEATKRAFATRNRIVTDFDRLREDPASVLTTEHLDREAAIIDLKKRRALRWRGADRRHGLDGRDRPRRPRRLLHPEHSTGNSAPAASCRGPGSSCRTAACPSRSTRRR